MIFEHFKNVFLGFANKLHIYTYIFTFSSGGPLSALTRYESRDWDGRGKYLIGSGRDRE